MRNYIVMKDGPGVHKISVASILFIGANGRFCQVFTSELVYSMRTTLIELLKTLPGEMFLQVHRAFVVNIQHVTGIRTSEVFIQKHRLPVARAYSKDLRERFMNDA